MPSGATPALYIAAAADALLPCAKMSTKPRPPSNAPSASRTRPSHRPGPRRDRCAPPRSRRRAVASLRARLLLRLAERSDDRVRLGRRRQALEAVGRHVPDDTALRFLRGVARVSLAIRRGPAERATRASDLIATAARLDRSRRIADVGEVTTRSHSRSRELALHDDPPDPTAFEPLDRDRRRLDRRSAASRHRVRRTPADRRVRALRPGSRERRRGHCARRSQLAKPFAGR